MGMLFGIFWVLTKILRTRPRIVRQLQHLCAALRVRIECGGCRLGRSRQPQQNHAAAAAVQRRIAERPVGQQNPARHAATGRFMGIQRRRFGRRLVGHHGARTEDNVGGTDALLAARDRLEAAVGAGAMND